MRRGRTRSGARRGVAMVGFSCLVATLPGGASAATNITSIPFRTESTSQDCRGDTSDQDFCSASAAVDLRARTVRLNLAIDSGMEGTLPHEGLLSQASALFTGTYSVPSGTRGKLTYVASLRIKAPAWTQKRSVGRHLTMALLQMEVKDPLLRSPLGRMTWVPIFVPGSSAPSGAGTLVPVSVTTPASPRARQVAIRFGIFGFAQVGTEEYRAFVPVPYADNRPWEVCAPGYWPDGSPCAPVGVPYRPGFAGSPAHNPTAAGSSSLVLKTTHWRLTVSSSPTAGVVPSAPRNLVAKSEKGAVRLSWGPPEKPGGSPVTSYSVHRRSEFPGDFDYTTLIAGGITPTAYTDPTAQSGKSYTYMVTAVNSAGEGVPSSQVAVTVLP